MKIIQKFKNKLFLKYLLIWLLVVILIGVAISFFKKNGLFLSKAANTVEESSEELSEEESISETEEPITEDESEVDTEQEEPVKQEVPDALSDESIHIDDIYATEYEDVRLISYVPGNNISYKWEKYNVLNRLWEEIESQSGYDDLYRNISYIDIKAVNNDLYRCNISGLDKDVTDNCRVRTLDRISDISVKDFDYDAFCYLNVNEIPVQITFEDGSQDDITGLNGLYFIDEVSSEPIMSVGDYGEMIKTVTVTTTYRRNCFIDNEKNEIKLLYKHLDKVIDINITGSDLEAPVINKVTFDYITSSTVGDIDVDVTVDATDNITPLPNLKYALCFESVKVSDKDYTEDMHFTKSVDKNGKYILYVKDEANNVSTYEEEMVVIDTKEPIINNITLSYEDWCKSEHIKVDATDGSLLKYRYLLKGGGFDSDWIDDDSCEIKQNGTYEVSVKDRGEHVVSQDIVVTNIDNTNPVINKITIIEESQNEK